MEMTGNCPMPQTHTRLFEAHRFWHEAEGSYQDPTEFTTKLNVALQSLRNVTFVMQSELSKEADFSGWYQSQREKMNKKDFMKWVVEARNTVVKRGDLKKKSIARVTVLTYEDNPIVKEEVPPFLPLSALLRIYSSQIKNPNPNWDVVLEVDRSWIVTGTSREVLTILRDTYATLAEIVSEWHSIRGVNINHCSICDHLHPNAPCSMSDDKYRVIRASLNEGTPYSFCAAPINVSKKTEKRAINRYMEDYKRNKTGHVDIPVEWDDSPWSEVNYFVGLAKTILRKDGCHLPIFHLFKKGKPVGILPIFPKSRPEKYLMMREMAKHIEEIGADGVVFTTELWFAPLQMDRKGNVIPPSESKERREALTVYIATSDMRARAYQTVFRKTIFGTIKFEKTTAEDIPKDSFMSPIFKVWKRG